MSSQSGSEFNNSRARVNRTKKTKAEPVAEKKSRRSNRKNTQLDQSENALPENIPITDSDELTMYHSYELEVTKGIIQIPVSMFRNSKMRKQTWTRVGQIIVELIIANNQSNQLVVLAKIKSQQSNNNIAHQKEPQDKKNKEKIKDPNNLISSEQQNEEDEFGQEAIFLVWGKICWIGAHQVCNKTIKQSPKTINTEQFSEIVKVKTKDVNSDIFLILNMRKKIECVNDYNGLINQGNTCYMNSYLQMLSHISEFKNLVFEASIVDENKFPATLQVLFHKLDNEQKPVSAQQLVKSFGWSKKEANIQQDAQEFSCLFYDVLERKLQQACPDPKHMSMSELFEGKLRN